MAMDNQKQAPLRPFRPVKTIPFELVQHCRIYFEEKLCPFPLVSFWLPKVSVADIFLVVRHPSP